MPSRRQVLGTVGLATLSGCLGTFSSGEPRLPTSSDATIDSVTQDHPQYRFDAQNRGANPAASGPDDAPPLVWKHERPTEASPLCTVADGKVYVGDDAGTVVALNATTGTPRWTADLGGTVRSAPAVSDGVVVVGSARGGGTDAGVNHALVGLSTTDGTVRWRKSIPGGRSVQSPTITDSLALVPFGDGSLLTLDVASGSKQWRAGSSQPWTTPATDGDLAFCSRHVIDVQTGNIIRSGTGTAAPTAVVDGTVFTGSDGAVALAADSGDTTWYVAPPDDHEAGSPVVTEKQVFVPFESPITDGGTSYLLAIDRTDGSEQWRTEIPSFVPEWAPFTVADGTAYVAKNGLQARDAATGEKRWQVADGVSFGRPVAVDGAVFVTTDRHVCAFA